MARTVEFTKDKILESAVLLVRTDGIANLNARNLAKWAGCSTAPLFRLFENMTEVNLEVKLKLDSIHEKFMSKYIQEDNILLTHSIAYIEFARKEPNIFFALFMNLLHKGMTITDILDADYNQNTILQTMKLTGLCIESAQQLFLKMWLYSHGVATQIVTSGIDIPSDLVHSLIEDAYIRFKEEW